MLSITRTPGKKLYILKDGQEIEVVMMGIDEWGEVVLGIDAPKEIPVKRVEPYEKSRSVGKTIADARKKGQGPVGRSAPGKATITLKKKISPPA